MNHYLFKLIQWTRTEEINPKEIYNSTWARQRTVYGIRSTGANRSSKNMNKNIWRPRETKYPKLDMIWSKLDANWRRWNIIEQIRHRFNYFQATTIQCICLICENKINDCVDSFSVYFFFFGNYLINTVFKWKFYKNRIDCKYMSVSNSVELTKRSRTFKKHIMSGELKTNQTSFCNWIDFVPICEQRHTEENDFVPGGFTSG